VRRQVVALTSFLFFSTTVWADVTPKDIERTVYSINHSNIEGKVASVMEKFFKVDVKDGRFNCVDRAWVGKKIAEQHGYKAFRSLKHGQGVDHMFLELRKNGKSWRILE
jgi:hypothetical protein